MKYIYKVEIEIEPNYDYDIIDNKPKYYWVGNEYTDIILGFEKYQGLDLILVNMK